MLMSFIIFAYYYDGWMDQHPLNENNRISELLLAYHFVVCYVPNIGVLWTWKNAKQNLICWSFDPAILFPLSENTSGISTGQVTPDRQHNAANALAWYFPTNKVSRDRAYFQLNRPSSLDVPSEPRPEPAKAEHTLWSCLEAGNIHCEAIIKR